MKITNKSQRLIKVGTAVILPNDTVEVDSTLEQYPALADLAECGDGLIVDEKATNRRTKKASAKASEKEDEKEDIKEDEKEDVKEDAKEDE